ncbi:uncharacterized protein LOC113760153 [Coffea eugenioides]|uniref:uncharacterized protein LOC113760153 n=1 Tax=Coffea eugenioides TaxID=49369 RepID=UPI000F607904|nr:uncharacterized protein LOC113760153 [Coffea eugenioides]
MDQTDHLVQSQQTSIQNLKRQVDQLAKAVAEKEPGKLLSNTEVNLKETTMVVTLCSGKVLGDPIIKSKAKPNEKQDESGIANESERARDAGNGSSRRSLEDNQHMKVPKVKPYVPPISFPQRLQKKFLNGVVSTKKLEDFAMMSLTEECSTVVQNHLPVKITDPGSFIVSCQFENIFVDKCLLSHPVGIVDDLLVKADKFYFPLDFLIFEMEEDISMSIILVRGFLSMEGANINLLEGKLTLRYVTKKDLELMPGPNIPLQRFESDLLRINGIKNPMCMR